MKWRLRAPATSANLGPGFDCLGVALDLWNEVEVDFAEGEGEIFLQLEGEGAGQLPQDENHLLLKVALDYLRKQGVSHWPSLRIRCINRIPLARGLGSSAATRVLGVLLGQLLHRGQTDLEEVLTWAGHLEHHPDNVAPAVYGGLCCSLEEEDGSVYSQSWPVHSCWKAVVAIPRFQLETEQSRSLLPTLLSRKDAIFNLSRLPWLLRGFGEGQAAWLALGCQDRWHQDYRAPLIAGMGDVFGAARKAGACAVHLSGAGPTLAAWVDSRAHDPLLVAQAMEQAWQGQACCRVLAVTQEGALGQALVAG